MIRYRKESATDPWRPLLRLPLCTRAIERAAARLHEPLDPLAHRLAGTPLARLALVAVDLPGVLEIAQFAVRLDVVAQA